MNRTCIVTALNTDSREVQSKQQVYFKYLLWATFGLSAVRFIGVSFPSLFDGIKLMYSVCTIGLLGNLASYGGGTRTPMKP